jgi:hypothetical protein
VAACRARWVIPRAMFIHLRITSIEQVLHIKLITRLLILSQIAAINKGADSAADAIKIKVKRSGMFLAAAYAGTGEKETRHVISIKQKEPFLKTCISLLEDSDFFTR